MLSYFTQPAPVLPQNQPQFYKFKIGETVRIDASPRERKSLTFKYSLNRGNKTLMGLKNFYLFMEWMLTGKLQNNVVGVIRTRKLLTKKNQIFPFYTVYIEKLDQVINSFFDIFFSTVNYLFLYCLVAQKKSALFVLFTYGIQKDKSRKKKTVIERGLLL